MNAQLSSKILVAATLLLPATAIAQDRYSMSGDRVAIYNLAGEVYVDRTPGANVIVEVTPQGKHADQLDIARDEADGWQRLVVRYPSRKIVYRRGTIGRFSRSEFGVNSDGTFGVRNLDPSLGAERVTANAGRPDGNARVRVAGSGSGLEANANIKVLVPAGKTVTVHLGVGRVVIADVAGDLQIDARSASVESRQTTGFLRIDTGSGSINVDRAAGDLAAYTGSGSVTVTHSGKGVVRISTGSGGVELSDITASTMSVSTGSGSITALEVTAPTAKLHTGSGGIRAQGLSSSKFDLDTGSGSVQLTLESDVDVGKIRTGSGGVSIVAARDLGASLTLDTGSGSIDVQLPVTVIEKRKSFFRGKVGDGQGMLDVGTGSGSITLR